MSGQSDVKELVSYLEDNNFTLQTPTLYSSKNPRQFGARLGGERAGQPFMRTAYFKGPIRCVVVAEVFEPKAVFIDVNPTVGLQRKLDPQQTVLHATYKVRFEGVFPMHKYDFLVLNAEQLRGAFTDPVQKDLDEHIAQQSTRIILDGWMPEQFHTTLNPSPSLKIWTHYAQPTDKIKSSTLFRRSMGNYDLASVVGMVGFVDRNFGSG